MAKAAWKGYITIGQLGIPVRLHSATQSSKLRFVQLHEKDGSPIERPLRCRAEQREISLKEVVRAVEYEPGHYITLTGRELERAENDGVKTIDVKQFADPDTIAPIYYEKPYYVTAAKGGERAYSLLREVFVRLKKIAVAQFVIYNKEHLCAISTYGDLLMLHQLRFDAEILPRSSLKVPALPKPSPAEVEALSAVVERFSGPFYIQDYHDEYAERIWEIVEHKAKNLPAPRSELALADATPEDEIVTVLHETLNDSRMMKGE